MPPSRTSVSSSSQDFTSKKASPEQNNEPQSAVVPYPGENLYAAEFVDQLNLIIRNSINTNSTGVLMLINVTNLAMIINAYGHETSEIVIHDLMNMIQIILPEGNRIQRLQRDQLGIILINSSQEDATIVAERIHHTIQNFGRDNFSTAALYIIGSIGSVSFPAETTDAHDALDKAYVAVNSTQNAPHRTFEMTRNEADECRQQMGLANYLFKAYKENRLKLAYQPIIKSTTGEVVHYEALLRIINQAGKIGSAGPLIPIAEKMGLIDLVDNMVMEKVIEELRQNKDLRLAFNVSNLTTENPTWLDTISNMLKHEPEVAARLIVEITETAAHHDLNRTAFFVASLQSLGCEVALDDFGSGYTSFRQLKALSVDMVKIDGSFIKDLAQNDDNRFFVKTLLDFTQGFGLETVAECVENGEVAKILMELGVDSMQGYYFGKPANYRPWLNEGEYQGEQ